MTIENQEGEKQAPSSDGAGSKPATTPILDAANVAAERLEKANAQFSENLKRQEELLAKAALSGKADAGAVRKDKTPEEIGAELAREAVRRYYG